MSNSLWPHGLYSPQNSPGQNTGVGNLSLLQGIIPNAEIEPRSPALQANSLPAEPQGKPKNTGVGSLCLLQQIFLTQKSNQSLLHCRRILYHLSHQGMFLMCLGRHLQLRHHISKIATMVSSSPFYDFFFSYIIDPIRFFFQMVIQLFWYHGLNKLSVLHWFYMLSFPCA